MSTIAITCRYAPCYASPVSDNCVWTALARVQAGDGSLSLGRKRLFLVLRGINVEIDRKTNP
jgi:hypothetical protein